MSTLAPSPVVFRGGVSCDLGRRHYGLRRVRATVPFGRLKVGVDELELWVVKTRLAPLPPNLPLPIVLSKDAVRVFKRWRLLGVGVGFKANDAATNYFWTFRPGRVIRLMRDFGYQVGG